MSEMSDERIAVPAAVRDGRAEEQASGPAPGRKAARSWLEHPALRLAAAFALPLGVLAAWQAAATLDLIAVRWFPPPLTLLDTFAALATGGELGSHVGITALRVLSGFALGAALGTLAGAATGCSPALMAVLDPTLQALRSIPALAWVPLYILWFGIYEQSKILLIATAVFFPVYLTLSSGIAQVDRRLLEVGRIFGMGTAAIVLRIIMPAALPYWVAALRTGLGMGWMCAVAAELMGASRGVGFLMHEAQQFSRADIIMASIVLFAVLGKVSDWMLVLLRNRLLRYQQAG